MLATGVGHDGHTVRRGRYPGYGEPVGIVSILPGGRVRGLASIFQHHDLGSTTRPTIPTHLSVVQVRQKSTPLVNSFFGLCPEPVKSGGCKNFPVVEASVRGFIAARLLLQNVT